MENRIGKNHEQYSEYIGNSLVLTFMEIHPMIPLKYQEISGEMIVIVEKEEDIRSTEVLLSNSAIQVWMRMAGTVAMP